MTNAKKKAAKNRRNLQTSPSIGNSDSCNGPRTGLTLNLIKKQIRFDLWREKGGGKHYFILFVMLL